MKAHGTLLLFVGTLTLAASAPTPRHHPQHLIQQQAQQTAQPEYEYDYEGSALQAEPAESASHYDAYIAEVQASNDAKKGFSRGSGLRTIAVGSANQAKTALGNQAAAGYQAAYVAKNTLAQSAAQASATAQAALAGKQVIMSGLEQQVRDAKVALQGEEMQLQQAKRAAQSAAQAAQQAMHQVNVIQAALNAAQATSENANEAASQAAGELGAQTAMVGAARQRVTTLQEQLHGVRIDFEATQAAARKAQGAAQQAQANAAEAAAKAAAAGLGGHKDAAYEESKVKHETIKQDITNSTKPYTTPSYNYRTRTFTTKYPNTGPEKFEFIIPSFETEYDPEHSIAPKPTEHDHPGNHKQLTTQANIKPTLGTISRNMWNDSRIPSRVKTRQDSAYDFKDKIRNALQQALIRSRESDHRAAHKFEFFAHPYTDQTPRTLYWSNTRIHNSLENMRKDHNGNTQLNNSEDLIEALQKPSFLTEKSTQQVNEDQLETQPQAIPNRTNFLSGYRYNPSQHKEHHQEFDIFKINEDLNKTTKTSDLSKSPELYFAGPLQMPQATQANFYLKPHTTMFIYEPRYLFHHDQDLATNQLDEFKNAPQNTSYTISNSTDPEFKKSRNIPALPISIPTPHTSYTFIQEPYEKPRQDTITEIDIPFEEIRIAQQNNSVDVESDLQSAVLPMLTKLDRSSLTHLITPTPYQTSHFKHNPRKEKPHQESNYPKIYLQLDEALQKFKRSKASEPDNPANPERMQLIQDRLQPTQDQMPLTTRAYIPTPHADWDKSKLHFYYRQDKP